MFEEITNLSTIEPNLSQHTSSNPRPTSSSRDESKDSLFEETTYLSTISQLIRPNQLTTISTRDQSKDSLFEEITHRTSIPPNLAQMNTKSQQKYVDSVINSAIAHKIANRNKSTQERPYDSSLEITNDATSTTTDQSNENSRQEYMDSIAKTAIAKTIADEKENVISTPDPKGLAGEGTKEEKENIISTPDPKGVAGERTEDQSINLVKIINRAS